MNDRRSLALLLAAQLAIVAIVQPRGEFPLNDDWAYAHSVQWLLDEHRIRLSDWIAMNLLPQTLAGGAVSALFGFSFETLRHLTQAVAILASAVAYGWFRTAGMNPANALVATLATMSAPFWPILANSYMTDLYGLVFALAAATLFLRALATPSRGLLIGATLLAAAGVLQRQVVMVVPFAFAVAWLWRARPLALRDAAIGIGPFVVAVAAELAFQAYLAHGPGVPEAQRVAHGRVFPLLMKALSGEEEHVTRVASNVASIAGWLGLLFAGWAAWWGMRGASPVARRVAFAIFALIAVLSFALDWRPPYRENALIDAAGIGPFALKGRLPRDACDATELWRAASLAAACGIAALLAALLANAAYFLRLRRAASPQRVFMAAVVVAYLAPFIVTDYFERYLLFVLPFLFALWALTWTGERPAHAWTRRGAALAWILATALLASAATRDYFSWSRARWDAIHAAERLGANPENLDGGFEYNGFTRYEEKPRGSAEGKSWWWVRDDRYAIALGPLPGYEAIETWGVRRWLSCSPAEVRLLRRR